MPGNHDEVPLQVLCRVKLNISVACIAFQLTHVHITAHDIYSGSIMVPYKHPKRDLIHRLPERTIYWMRQLHTNDRSHHGWTTIPFMVDEFSNDAKNCPIGKHKFWSAGSASQTTKPNLTHACTKSVHGACGSVKHSSWNSLAQSKKNH